jgi:hypothetical protein
MRWSGRLPWRHGPEPAVSARTWESSVCIGRLHGRCSDRADAPSARHPSIG